MPRIPEADIERVKQQTDLLAIIRSRGVELRRHGVKDWAGRCPFHREEAASFIVSPGKGLFHCMGCGAAGNVIQFVQRFDGVSFRHAYELLAEGGAAAFQVRTTEPMRKATIPRLPAPFAPEAGDAELFAKVVDYYHERLLKTPAALAYLKKRGVYDAAAIEKFRLGFADRTLGLRLPDSARLSGVAIRQRLQKLGFIRESGHEHFNGSLVVPTLGCEPHGRQGQPVGMYGRKIRDDLRKGTPLHLYLPGPHAGIWNAEALAGGELILCEAAFDALTFYVNGFQNVTFLYGTEGFTQELFDAIIAQKVQRVRLAYDADEAGNRAASRDAPRLAAHGIECYRVKFPWGMDANEYAQKVKPPDKSLGLLLRSAEWMAGSTVGKPKAESGQAMAAESSHASASAPVSSVEIAAPVAASSLAAKKETLPAPALPEAPGTEPRLRSPATSPQSPSLLHWGCRSWSAGASITC